ncbi:hypothetical protein [Endothiovibrio diazotrophicus]
MPQGRVAEAVEGPPEGEWRLAIYSIGDASAALIPTLRRISSLPPAQLASLLYRAPSILADGLEREVAEAMAGLLRRTGVVVEPLHCEAPFEPGEGAFDLALSVRDPARLGEVAALVSELLGCSLEEGRKLVCASPALLMGAVSAATVEALSRRFSALGVEVDVSRPQEALYDLFIGEAPPAMRAGVARVLTDGGVAEVADEGALIAAGLDWSTARRVWPPLQRIAVPLRLLSHDFQRFDVSLDRVEGSEALYAYLAEVIGMPREVAEQAPSRLPLVLLRGVARGVAMEAVAQLTGLGAEASVHLLAFRRFALELPATRDSKVVARLLRTVGGLSPEVAAAGAAGGRVRGSFGEAQALWLQAELRRAGVEADVVSV